MNTGLTTADPGRDHQSAVAAPGGFAAETSGAKPGTARPVTFRQMGPADAQLMTWLERQVFPEDPWSAEMVAEELSAPHRYYVCAQVTGDAQANSAQAPATTAPATHLPPSKRQPHSAGFPPEPRLAQPPAEQQGASPNLVNPWNASGVAGWAGVRVGEDGDVMTIGVLPDFRGHHIGRALMDHLLAYARKADVSRLFLEVRASNMAAINLYETVGFKRMGIIKRYFHHPSEDAISMRLILGQPIAGGGVGAVGDEISKNALT